MAGVTVKVTIDDRVLRKMIADTAGKGPIRIIADGVEYGKFVELGTSKMAAQPALGPAVESVRPGFVAAIKQNGANFGRLEMVIEKGARDIERGWKAGAAVDTGAYKNSIHVIKAEAFSFTAVI